MKTIQTIATVTEDGKLTVQVSTDIAPGEHQIVLVIDETPAVKRQHPPLKFSDYPVGVRSADFTFRREDLYSNGEC
jgi:hypothetical protein